MADGALPSRTGDLVRWVLLLALVAAQFLPTSANTGLLGLVVGELPVVIALLHFAAWTTWGTALVGLVVMYSIAYVSEFLGTHTGLIFGEYFYSPTAIGPLVGEVPILLPLAYFSMGYAAYAVTRTMLRNTDRRLGPIELLFTSALAALVMTLIDLVSDPIAATLNGKWTWEQGGAFFGVPVHNFYGWLGTTFTFFVVVSLLLNRRSVVSRLRRPFGAQFRWQAIVLYATYGLGVFVNPFLGRTNEIYDAMSMLAFCTAMIPIIAAGMAVNRTREDVRSRH